MRLPGSVPVFFRFLEKGEETGPFRLLFCNGHRSDVRVYALIPVKEALGVDGLADLQGLYSGIYIRGSVAEVGFYNEGIGLAVIGNVKVKIVAFRAASIPVVKESDVIAVRILSCGLHSQSLKGGQLVLAVDELVLAQSSVASKGSAMNSPSTNSKVASMISTSPDHSVL